MADITSFLAGMGVSIRNISTSVNARRDANIRLVLEVKSREQMDSVIRQLQRRKDIIDVFCQRPHKTMLMVTHYREEYPKNIDHEIYLKKIV